RGPQLAGEIEVAGAPGVCRQQPAEERCGVDAAVVATERNFAGGRHLPVAPFVKNLARLFIAARIHLAPLKRGETAQDPGGELGREGESLEGGDQGVAAEDGREPWNPR